MKKLIGVLFSVAVFFVLSTSSAQADDKCGFYLTPKIFYSHVKADIGGVVGKYSDNVAGVALALGYDFNERNSIPIRTEIEFATRGKAETSVYGLWGTPVKGDFNVRVSSLFANVYYDFHNQSDFTPYIGAGLGAARLKGESKVSSGGYKFSGSKTEWDFAWNVGAGVAYKLTDMVSLDLGYRYSDFGSISEDGFDDMDFTGHEVLLGVRFAF